jgi:hypothetical protein
MLMPGDDRDPDGQIPAHVLALWHAKFGQPLFPEGEQTIAVWNAFYARLAKYDEATADLVDAFSLGKPLSEAQVEYMDESIERFLAEIRRRRDVGPDR